MSSISEEGASQSSIFSQCKNKIKNGQWARDGIKVQLDPTNIVYSFYKKQDYEPFAIPFGFPVLDDINFKLEMKKIDQAICRTIENVILLITMGTEPSKGGINHKNMRAMQGLMNNESVGRILVADYTTNAKFVIPDIGNLLDPKKYEILDNDIRMGLNSILFGEEKFSNTSIKVKVFFARLKYGREKFLRDFLIPEMKEVGRALGFKQIPTPKLEDIDFEDNVLMSRVYSRLIELGVLTPEEGFDVFQSGRLPTSEESIESQKKYKALKEKGYYQPLIGGAKDPNSPAGTGGNKNPAGNSGRPTGSGGKQLVTRKQASASVESDNIETFSCEKMKTVLASITSLEKNIETVLKAKFKIKKLNKQQAEIVSDIAILIAQNEKLENWNKTFDLYIQDMSRSNPEIYRQIDELAANHGIDIRSASILYHSKK